MDIEAVIISLLREHHEVISGEELSREFNISRVAIWKHIENLRQIGYKIEAEAHRGYRFISAPDRVLAMEIRYGLKTRFIGHDIRAYEEVSSTNDIALDLARREAKEGTVVIAESQSSGRGRMGRSWFSPFGKGLWASIIFYPELLPNQLGRMNLVFGVALAEAIKKETSLPVELKWPNDVMVSGKKAGGILIEMSAEMDQVKYLVVGLGLNVNVPLSDFPKHLRESASSLSQEKGNSIDRLSLIREILRQIENYYLFFKEKGITPIREKWLVLSKTLGHYLKVELPARTIYGQAVDVDEEGALLLRTEHGLQERITAGDIYFIS